MNFNLLIKSCILICFAFGFSAQFSDANEDIFFANIIGDDAYLYVENIPKNNNKTSTFIDTLSTNPDLIEVFSPLKKYIKGMDSIAAMVGGISPLRTIEKSSKKMGLAIIRTKGNHQGIVFWIDLGNELKNFKKNLPTLESFLNDKTTNTITTIEINNHKIKVVTFGIAKFAWVFAEKNIVFGEYNYIVKLAKNNFKTNSSISQSKEYLKSLEIMQLKKGGTIAIANINTLAELIEKKINKTNSKNKQKQIAKDVPISKLSIGIIPYKNGYKDVTIVWIQKDNDILTKVFSPKNTTLRHCKYAPIDTEYFISSQLILDNCYLNSSKTINTLKNFFLSEEKADKITALQTTIKNTESELMFSFSEILATLGSETTLVISPSGSFMIIDLRSRLPSKHILTRLIRG